MLLGGLWLQPSFTLREYGVHDGTTLSVEPRGQVIRGAQKRKHGSVELGATQPPGVGAVDGAFERRELIKPTWVTYVSFKPSSKGDSV